MSRVYVGDTGTEIRLFCVEDISAAVSPAIAVQKPDGTQTSWPATQDGTDLFYIIPDNTVLDQPGDWLLQAQPNLPSWQGCGDTVVLKVFAKFAL